MPIARIINKKLDEDYIPPAVVLSVARTLCLVRLVKFLRDKLSGISYEHPSFGVLLESMLEIEALIRNEAAHPFTVYISLIRLLGRSFVFSYDKSVPLYTLYNHLNIAGCYESIVVRIKKNLSLVKDVTSEFFAEQDGQFVLKLVPGYAFKK